MVVNKPPLLTVTPVHRSLLFCIAPCSVQLVGSASVEYDLVHESDDNTVFLSLSFFSWYTVNTVARNHKKFSFLKVSSVPRFLALKFFHKRLQNTNKCSSYNLFKLRIYYYPAQGESKSMDNTSLA